MAVTLSRPRSASTPVAEDLRLGVGRSKRRPWLAVGSLVLIATCAAAFTSLYAQAGHQTRVLVIDRLVPQGNQIQAADISAATLSYSSAIAPIPAADAVDVIGRRAAVSLVPGTLLIRAELSAGQWPPRGLALVGVIAKPGQLPAGGVAPGQTVDIVLTQPVGTPFSSSGSSSSSDSPSGSDQYTLVHDAVVSDVTPEQASPGADTVVTVVVPEVSAGTVANASSAGQVAIVVVTPRS